MNMVRLAHALNDLDPPVHALVVYNSNPATTAPDSTRVEQGLAREDLFTVVLEHFLTDTARYADVVLPATTQVEHLDLMFSWGHIYVTYNEPAIAPVGEAVPNTEIFRRLARAMGFDGAGVRRDRRGARARGDRGGAGAARTPSTSSACARSDGPRRTSPRTSGRSRRAASGRRRGACGCGRRTCRPGSTRHPATPSRWRS